MARATWSCAMCLKLEKVIFLHIKHLPCALEDKIRTKNCLNIPFMNLLDNKTLARASLISGW